MTDEQAFRRFRRSPLDASVVRRQWLDGHDGQQACGPVKTSIWVANPRLPTRVGAALVGYRSTVGGVEPLAGIAVALLALVFVASGVLSWPFAALTCVLTVLVLVVLNVAGSRLVRSRVSGLPGFAAAEMVCDTMESTPLGGYRVALGQLVWDMVDSPTETDRIVRAVGEMATQARRYAAQVERRPQDQANHVGESESMRLLGAVTEALRTDNEVLSQPKRDDIISLG